MPSGLRPLELVARRVDQRAGLAVHARDRVGTERGDLAEALQQDLVGDRLHDAGHARHVELERADAELLGVARQLGDLLLGEDLRMKHRVDVAALIHGAAERRQMVVVGVFEAAQEDADGGDAAEHAGAGLGLRLHLERQLVADMDVRIEDARHDDPAAGVQHLLGRLPTTRRPSAVIRPPAIPTSAVTVPTPGMTTVPLRTTKSNLPVPLPLAMAELTMPGIRW